MFIMDMQANDDKAEEDLIDIDEILSERNESSWLTTQPTDYRSVMNETSLQIPLSQLKFSSPTITEFVKMIYENGNSKKTLHNLLYWNNQRMTVSWNNSPLSYDTRDVIQQRVISNSMSMGENYFNRFNETSTLNPSNKSLVKQDSECTLQEHNSDVSPTDSLNNSQTNLTNTVQMRPKSKRSFNTTRMTQSSVIPAPISIADESTLFTQVKPIQDNILSRTYDKEELEMLKKSQMSKSVYDPSPTSNQFDLSPDQPMVASFTNKSSASTTNNNNNNKRFFPLSSKSVMKRPKNPKLESPNKPIIFDKIKLNNSDIDYSMKSGSSVKPFQSLNYHRTFPKQVLAAQQKIFESDVVQSPPSTKNPPKSNSALSTSIPVIKSKLKQPMHIKKVTK